MHAVQSHEDGAFFESVIRIASQLRTAVQALGVAKGLEYCEALVLITLHCGIDICHSAYIQPLHCPRGCQRREYHFQPPRTTLTSESFKVNVLISRRGEAVLGDFGIAKIIDDFPDGGVDGRPHGSVRWMAPELMAADPSVPGTGMTTASDIYAFGCLLLEVCQRHLG
jgi:serine/threonine protein kinase